MEKHWYKVLRDTQINGRPYLKDAVLLLTKAESDIAKAGNKVEETKDPSGSSERIDVAASSTTTHHTKRQAKTDGAKEAKAAKQG